MGGHCIPHLKQNYVDVTILQRYLSLLELQKHWEDPEGSGGEGGGRGDWDGNTCKSMADSFQCMTKPTTIKKKKNKKNRMSNFNNRNILSPSWELESQTQGVIRFGFF